MPLAFQRPSTFILVKVEPAQTDLNAKGRIILRKSYVALSRGDTSRLQSNPTSHFTDENTNSDHSFLPPNTPVHLRFTKLISQKHNASSVLKETRNNTNQHKTMESRRRTTGMLATMLCLSWIVGFVTPTSVHGIANNTSRSHDHGLRSATSKASSLGESDNDVLNELKNIVLFLSQKIDDSDARIQSLEDKVRNQALVIKSLKSDVNDASSFHRYLQSDDSDCLPTFRNTAFGPRCDYNYVARFQNRTFFNDDVVFNENVEFDSDANCLPTYNSTTQMCRLNNNFTFDDGDINFEHSVQFDDDVKFRDSVRMESDVEFNKGGEVQFNKYTKFYENVLIANDDHSIEFKLEGDVNAKFYQDPTFKIDTHTTFYQDVDLEKDLDVKGKLKVKKTTSLDNLDVYGYLWVKGKTYLEDELKAEHRATIDGGLTVKTGKLVVSEDGAEIHGATTLSGAFTLNGRGNATENFYVGGKLTANSVQFDNGLTVATGKLVVKDGAKIFGATTVSGNFDVDGELTANSVVIGENGSLKVNGHATFDSISTAKATINGQSITDSNKSDITSEEIVKLLEGQRLELESVSANSVDTERATISFVELDGFGNEVVLPGRLTVGKKDVMDMVRNLESLISSDLNLAEVLELLNGQHLVVESVSANSVDTNSAIINGQAYEQPSSTSSDMTSAKILELLNGQKLVVESVFADSIEAISSLKKWTYEVATMDDINNMQVQATPVAASESSCTCEFDIDEVVLGLEGKSLSVSSIEASYLTKSGLEVATKDDVEESESSCTCDASQVETVVNSMGFKTEGEIEAIVGVIVDSIAPSVVTAAPQECSCSKVDIEDMGFIDDCSCSIEDSQITDVVDAYLAQVTAVP